MQAGSRSWRSSMGEPLWIAGAEISVGRMTLRGTTNSVKAQLKELYLSCCWIQEAQLMLTNPRDAFRGQTRSPNIVPTTIPYVRYFSSFAIVTLSLRHVNLSIQTVFMLMMMMNRGYKVQQSAPTYDVVNRTSSNDKLTANCKMSLFFFPPAYLVVTGTRYTLLIYYTPEVNMT